MNCAAVTTFPNTGYECGERMIESVLAFWPITLYVYYEGERGNRADTERLKWLPLDAIEDRRLFMRRHMNESQKNYRRQVVKFSHKVWAMTSAPRDADYLIWLDADTEITRPVTDSLLSKCLPGTKQVASYLGRVHVHTETGWLAFNLRHYGSEFLNDFRKKYTSDDIAYQLEQHDCRAFDMTRDEYIRKGFDFKNLTQTGSSTRPFEYSPLNEFIRHDKGTHVAA